AGSDVESVGVAKDQTSVAAELHMVSALSTAASGVKQLVGGLHLRKCGGDLLVKAPTIILGGGGGKFHRRGRAPPPPPGPPSLHLNGGPVRLRGSTIAIGAAGIVKMASNLKIG